MGNLCKKSNPLASVAETGGAYRFAAIGAIARLVVGIVV